MFSLLLTKMQSGTKIQATLQEKQQTNKNSMAWFISATMQ